MVSSEARCRLYSAVPRMSATGSQAAAARRPASAKVSSVAGRLTSHAESSASAPGWGFTAVKPTRAAAIEPSSRVTVAPAAGTATAGSVQRTVVEVAGTGETAGVLGARVATALGVPVDAVRLGEATGGADVRVVLGPDFAADVARNGV